MKKIVALGAMAALAGGMIFAEPVFEPSVTLDGNASVKWGVDLDAGKTGFKNETGGDFKVKLWGDGSRELEAGDGIWAELKVTGKEATINKGKLEGGAHELNEAKLHFNDFYIGIKSGDTQVGAYNFATAIRGDDGDGSKWIAAQGPDKYTQGIVAGYGNDNFAVDVDFRSLENATTQYTNSYAVAAEAQLKDSNEWVGGLAVKAGVAYNLSNEYYTAAEAAKKAKYTFDEEKGYGVIKEGDEAKTATGATDEVLRTQYGPRNGHVLGYGASASYKLPVGDYYLKPQVAFAGNITTNEIDYTDGTDTKVGKITKNHNELGFGVMFGFGGDKGDNTGVYFLNGDESKKSEPGVGLVVVLPLADKTTKVVKDTYTATEYGKALAYVMPSFYSNGELVENLKIGFYSEIVPLRFENPDMKDSYFDGTDKNPTDPTKWNYGKTIYSKDKEEKSWLNAKDKDNTLALGVAAGLAYTIKSDDLSITPKFGIRYANAAYVDNNVKGLSLLAKNPVFDNMGEQAVLYKETKDSKNYYSRNGVSDGDFFNLKAGVDVAGLINNTTFFAEYASANLLNKIDYKAEKAPTDGNPNYKIGSGAGKFGFYNQKLGTFNVGCKISF